MELIAAQICVLLLKVKMNQLRTNQKHNAQCYIISVKFPSLVLKNILSREHSELFSQANMQVACQPTCLYRSGSRIL